MTLDKNDLKEIKKIVDGTEKRLDLKINKEIGLLRLEINERFEETNEKMDVNQDILLEKIDQIKQMENEDILAISKDVAILKKKVLV